MKKLFLVATAIFMSITMGIAQDGFPYEPFSESYPAADEQSVESSDDVMAKAGPGSQAECLKGTAGAPGSNECCWYMDDLAIGTPRPQLPNHCPVGSGVLATVFMGLGYIFFRSRRKE